MTGVHSAPVHSGPVGRGGRPLRVALLGCGVVGRPVLR
ncbi:MAG: hypothetical protein V7637_5831, partial [Mycobacteriales bacterium]